MRRLAAVLVLLAAVPACAAPPQRDAVGGLLPDGAVTRVGTPRGRLPGAVFGLALSSDGTIVFASADDGLVRELYAATGAERARHGDGGEAVRVLDRSPDGRLVAAADRAGAIRVWDRTAGKQAWRSGNNMRSIETIAFSPDGRTLAAAGSLRPNRDDVAGPYLALFDVATGRESVLPTDRQREVGALAWAPDGASLAVGTLDGNVELWDLRTQIARSWNAHHQTILALAYSPNGHVLASAGKDFNLRFWDPSTATRRAEAPVHELFTRLTYSPDGRALFAAAGDDAWHLDSSGAEVRRLRGHTQLLTALALSGDGRTVATADRGGALRLWDAADGRVRTATAPPDPIRAIAVSSDSRTLAVGQGRSILLCELSGKVVRQLDGHALPVTHLVFATRGEWLASAAEPGDPRPVRVWDLTTGDEPLPWGDRLRDVRGLAFTPDGLSLAILEAAAVTLHCPIRGRYSGELRVPADVGALTRFVVSPDGQLLAAGSVGGGRVVWDVSERRVRFSGSGGKTCRGLGFLSDGRRLVCLDETELAVWDSQTGAAAGAMAAEAWVPGASAFAVDRTGRMLALSLGSVVELWDVLARRPVRRFRGHLAPVKALTFTPDGRSLVSGSDDGTAILWDTTALVGASSVAAAGEWDELSSADPVAARRAIWRLAAAPGTAARMADRVAELADRWQRIGRLMDDLDDDRYAVREKASRELATLGDLIAAALKQALEAKQPPERRRRLENLLRECGADDAQAVELNPERRRWLRCVEVLERVGTEEARKALTALADLPTGDLAEEARAVLKRLQ